MQTIKQQTESGITSQKLRGDRDIRLGRDLGSLQDAIREARRTRQGGQSAAEFESAIGLRSIYGNIASSYNSPDADRGFTRIHERIPPRLSGPVQFFAKLIERWELTEGETCKLLGLDEKDAVALRDLLSGTVPLVSRDIRDRIRALLVMRELLRGLYQGDTSAERQWLRCRTPKLDEEAPLSRMTDGGMEGLLMVRDYLRWRSGL